MVSSFPLVRSLVHLVCPHVCSGCGSDLLNEESSLCIRCLSSLPTTEFQFHANNPVEKTFWGRIPLVNASAQYYFTKESLMQHLMHALKYGGDKELGLQLGRLMGYGLRETVRFNSVDALVALPLFPKKEKKRGYNQAQLLCEGMAEVMRLPVIRKAVVRTEHTQTQTKKGRMERWENIEGKFEISDLKSIRYTHLLLVDDVITTGATLESCGAVILEGPSVTLSVAALCYAVK